MMAGLPCLILAGRGQEACRWGKRVKMTVGVTTTVYPSTGSGQAVTQRINPAGVDITLAYDQENRLMAVSGNRTASYTYNGDGNLVKAVDDTNKITTTVVGPHYEVRAQWMGTAWETTVRKYYYAGNVRVAMRDNGTLYWLLTDHLGSTSLTLDSSGNRLDPTAELVSVSRWGHAGGQNGALRSVKGSKKRPPPAHNGFEPTREKGYTVPS